MKSGTLRIRNISRSKQTMKQEITDLIKAFVTEYESRDEIATNYGEPLVGFANSIGSEVCGKCITGSPCAFWNI